MTATILIVDDKEQNRKLLQEKLLKEYYTVVTADSGKMALQLLKEIKIDLVLLDVMMPEMDGFETCYRIKTNPNTTYIPVIIITALSDTADRVKGLQAGADEFITKPIDNTPLFARIRSLSRIKTILDASKLRNSTAAELGGNMVEMEDNFREDKILIIDDKLDQAKLIKSYIKIVSPKIYHLSSPDELDNFSDFVPDLIILSCQIPDTDPLRFCASFRTSNNLRYTPLMLLIEKENSSLIVKAIELGVNDYFLYPVDQGELQARVRTQLRKRRYHEDLRTDLEDSVDLSTKDGLTNLFNRRYFDTHIEQMVEKANRTSHIISLLILDMDHFKLINDTYGHQAGDRVLKLLALILKASVRAGDLTARYGGEEFAILLSGASGKQAMQIAETIRKRVEKYNFDIPGKKSPLHKTLSIGVAEYKKGESIEYFTDRADKALYQSKNTGRNKVTIAQ